LGVGKAGGSGPTRATSQNGPKSRSAWGKKDHPSQKKKPTRERCQEEPEKEDFWYGKDGAAQRGLKMAARGDDDQFIVRKKEKKEL